MEAAIYATAGLLFVGLLSGLAFLGVHYPKTFDHITRYLGYVFLTISAANIGYSFGVINAGGAAMSFVPAAKASEAKAAIDAVKINGVINLALWIVAIFFIGMSIVSGQIDREKKEIEAARKEGK